jgi:uncharacterized membrane protein
MNKNSSLTGNIVTWVIVGVLAVGYAVFAHYASAMTDIGAWAILLAGAPLIVVGIGFARESRWGLFAVGLATLLLGALAWAWPQLHNPASWLYFLQHCGVNALLAAFFGRTLAKQRRPLCTVFASAIHEEMTPELLRYTRQVTAAWALFFLASAVLSVVLFFFATIEAWSVFANILSMPLIGAMFLIENEVRKRVLPVRDQLGLKATVRAFRANFRS